MTINFRQLEVFGAVADTKSFTRACHSLFISQSTVSQHIRELEETLKVKLFDRNRRNVSLTAAGENLLHYRRDIFRLLEEAETAAHDTRDPYSGRLAFGCASTTLLYQMPALLMRYAKRFPKVDLKVLGGTIRDLLSYMESDSLDFSLVVLPLSMPDFKKIRLWEESFVAVLPKNHRMAREKSIDIESLAKERFILHVLGQNTRRLVDRYMSRHGISPYVPIEIAETETIKAMVAKGLGVSILPASAFSGKTSRIGLKLFPIGQPELRRSLALVYHKSKRLRPPAVAMIELLQQHFSSNTPKGLLSPTERLP